MLVRHLHCTSQTLVLRARCGNGSPKKGILDILPGAILTMGAGLIAASHGGILVLVVVIIETLKIVG